MPPMERILWGDYGNISTLADWHNTLREYNVYHQVMISIFMYRWTCIYIHECGNILRFFQRKNLKVGIGKKESGPHDDHGVGRPDSIWGSVMLLYTPCGVSHKRSGAWFACIYVSFMKASLKNTSRCHQLPWTIRVCSDIVRFHSSWSNLNMHKPMCTTSEVSQYCKNTQNVYIYMEQSTCVNSHLVF